MEDREWIEACLAKASKNYDGAEIYYNKSRVESWHMRQGELNKVDLDEYIGAELVVHRGEFWAQAYTEKLDEEAMEYLLRRLEEMIQVIPPHPYRRLYGPEDANLTEWTREEEGRAIRSEDTVRPDRVSEGTEEVTSVPGCDLPDPGLSDKLPDLELSSDLPDPGFSVDGYLDFLAELTSEARDICEKIKAIDKIEEINASFWYKSQEIQLVNTLGLNRHTSWMRGDLNLSVLLRHEDEMQSGGAFRFLPRLEVSEWGQIGKTAEWGWIGKAAEQGRLDKTTAKQQILQAAEQVHLDRTMAREMAQEAVKKAIGYFGAKPVPTGDYLIILEANAWGTFLNAALCAHLSGEAALEHSSLLTGKQDQKIASPLLTLYDDPTSSKNPASRAFDDEGVPTRKMALVKNGILQEYVQTITSARQSQWARPGNAYRDYKKSTYAVIRFLTMEPGPFDQKSLLDQAAFGLYITSLEALDAGINGVNGDFSLKAKGFQIVDGQIGPPVDQITIAGNLLDVLQNIEAVGSDLILTRSLDYLPSVYIGALAVTGL